MFVICRYIGRYFKKKRRSDANKIENSKINIIKIYSSSAYTNLAMYKII